MSRHPLEELRTAMREVVEAQAFVVGWCKSHPAIVAELPVMAFVGELSQKAGDLCQLLEEVMPADRALLNRVIQSAASVAVCIDGPVESLRDEARVLVRAVRELQPLPEQAAELNGERVRPVEFCGVPGCSEHRASES